MVMMRLLMVCGVALAGLTTASADLRKVRELECRIVRAVAMEWKDEEPTVSENTVDEVQAIALDHRRGTARVKGKPSGLRLSFRKSEGLTIAGPNFSMLIADDPTRSTYRMVITSSVAIASTPATGAAVGGDLMIGSCSEVGH